MRERESTSVQLSKKHALEEGSKLVQRLNFNKGKRYTQNERKMDRQKEKE